MTDNVLQFKKPGEPVSNTSPRYWEVTVVAPNGLVHCHRIDPMLVDLLAVSPVAGILDDPGLRDQVRQMYDRRNEANPYD